MPVSTVLLDIDTQSDFCDREGRLFVPGADDGVVRGAMRALVRAAQTSGVPHIATADDHQLSDPEISDDPDFARTFPAHCLRATAGAAKIPETAQMAPLVLADGAYDDQRLAALVAANREILLLKQSFDCFSNPHTSRVLDHLGVERAVVFGVATDICVDAAVAGLLARGVDVVVAEQACAGLDAGRVAACRRHWTDAGAQIVPLARALDILVAAHAGQNGAPAR